MISHSGIVHETLLAEFSNFVAARMGLYFPRERWCDLERGVGSAARDFAQADAQTCIEWLMSHPLTKRDIEMLAVHLTIGETYFFREEKSFAALEAHILPNLIHQHRENKAGLRIWSAGCSTGEEPYSIAILLDRMIPALDDNSFTLLATDINPYFLRKAVAGRYSEWSFRTNSPWLKERYFIKTPDGRFEIDPRIRRRVMFSYFNLAEEVYSPLLNNPNAMNIILCRNVLMYFTKECMRKVVDNFHRCLVEGGWLVVSPSEASSALFSKFVTVNYPGVILYRKEDSRRCAVDVQPYSSQIGVHSFCPTTTAISSKLIENTQRIATTGCKIELSDPLKQTQALYDQSRYAEVVATLQAVLTRDCNNIAAMRLLARTLANQGKLAEARAWCEKAVAMDKLNPVSHHLLAIILQEYGRGDEAVVSLKRALYLDPDFAVAHFALGNLVHQQGKREDAVRHFQNALAILDKYPPGSNLPEAEGITAGRLKEVIRMAVPGVCLQ